MGLYPGIPSIRTLIIKRAGLHLTQVWKDNVIIKTVPTHRSQIRTDDKCYLWQPNMDDDGTITTKREQGHQGVNKL